MARNSPTPKQQQVLDLLTEGKSIQQVANKMKITTAGVYGHMRKLRDLGIVLPSETPPSSSAPPAPPAEPVVVTGNGRATDAEAALKAYIGSAEERSKQIAAEVTGHRSAIEELEAEASRLDTAVEKHRRALEALA